MSILLNARQAMADHVQESAGHHNSGPVVSLYLKYVHLDDGEPWCASAICYWAQGTALVVSGSALGLLHVNKQSQVNKNDIQIGDIVVWDHGGGKGHCGVVNSITTINGKIAFTSIEGNTSDPSQPSVREGWCVAEHVHDMEDPKLAGFFRIPN